MVNNPPLVFVVSFLPIEFLVFVIVIFIFRTLFRHISLRVTEQEYLVSLKIMIKYFYSSFG